MMGIVAPSNLDKILTELARRLGIERAYSIFVSTANKVTICSCEWEDGARLVSSEDARIINCDIVLEQLY